MSRLLKGGILVNQLTDDAQKMLSEKNLDPVKTAMNILRPMMAKVPVMWSLVRGRLGG